MARNRAALRVAKNHQDEFDLMLAEEYAAIGRPVPMPLPPAACGTPSGYQAHRNRGEDPCEPCRVAAVAKSTAYARAEAALRDRFMGEFRRIYQGPMDRGEGGYGRALAELRHRHPVVFRRLHLEQKELMLAAEPEPVAS